MTSTNAMNLSNLRISIHKKTKIWNTLGNTPSNAIGQDLKKKKKLKIILSLTIRVKKKILVLLNQK